MDGPLCKYQVFSIYQWSVVWTKVFFSELFKKYLNLRLISWFEIDFFSFIHCEYIQFHPTMAIHEHIEETDAFTLDAISLLCQNSQKSPKKFQNSFSFWKHPIPYIAALGGQTPFRACFYYYSLWIYSILSHCGNARARWRNRCFYASRYVAVVSNVDRVLARKSCKAR